MTLAELRREVPSWTWSAERDGFGWRYIGQQGDKIVEFRCYADIASDDESFRSFWADRKSGMRYSMFWLNEAAWNAVSHSPLTPNNS